MNSICIFVVVARAILEAVKRGCAPMLCAGLSLLVMGFMTADARADGNRDRVLTVMTHNMDNGTDFGPIFAAQSPSQLLIAVAVTYAEVQASNIPERAAALAKEIAAANPDLVGLQEVYTYYVGPIGGPATTVTYDALQSLLDALAQRGLHYAPVAVLTNLDAEVPAFDPGAGLFFDVRATDHDVVLARTDLPVSQLKLSNVQVQHFSTNATFSNPLLGTLEILHGWISVDGKKRGKPFRFVTTHLDSISAAVPSSIGKAGGQSDSGSFAFGAVAVRSCGPCCGICPGALAGC